MGDGNPEGSRPDGDDGRRPNPRREHAQQHQLLSGSPSGAVRWADHDASAWRQGQRGRGWHEHGLSMTAAPPPPADIGIRARAGTPTPCNGDKRSPYGAAQITVAPSSNDTRHHRLARFSLGLRCGSYACPGPYRCPVHHDYRYPVRDRVGRPHARFIGSSRAPNRANRSDSVCQLIAPAGYSATPYSGASGPSARKSSRSATVVGLPASMPPDRTRSRCGGGPWRAGV